MGVDVATLLAQYEDATVQEPMHGQQGEIRRNPSTDQRKVRRQMTKKKADVADVATIAELLAQAALAPTLEQKRALLTKVEELRTERDLVTTAERSLDFTVKEAVEIIPAGTHELHTEQTDWLSAVAAQHKDNATADEATQSLVAEASMWFERVPDYVKAVPEEFATQATNKARHVASQYGEHAEVAAQGFVIEAIRLHKLAVRGGLQVEAAKHRYEPETDRERDAIDNNVGTGHEPRHNAPDIHGQAMEPASVRGHMPDIHAEFDRVLRGDDAAGVREMGEGYAQQVIRGHAALSVTSRMHGETDETADLSTLLAGFQVEAASDPASVHVVLGASNDPIGSGMDTVEKGLDATSDGVRDASDAEVQRELATQAASQVPQVGSQGQGGTSGLPTDTFNTFSGNPVDQNTDSNRAPALQEIQNFVGWDGTSVVPQGDSGAVPANNDQSGLQDAADTPLASTYAKIASKESNMDQAACPTCSGTGHVAVRKQAYSGLPQIDQIVNADESPGTTPLPEDVAFPLTGWGASPQQGQQNIQNTINEAEGQVSERNAKSPLLKGSQLHQANGRDNSGWLGDDGAKGVDYPGYSAPTGYDGSNNLGQPDPVYGYGGDNGNQPLKPYGAEEANDITNNPGQPYDPSVPHNNDQAYRSVGPGMSTQGSHDPFVAAAQEEIQRQQQIIRERTAQLQRQAG